MFDENNQNFNNDTLNGNDKKIDTDSLYTSATETENQGYKPPLYDTAPVFYANTMSRPAVQKEKVKKSNRVNWPTVIVCAFLSLVVGMSSGYLAAKKNVATPPDSQESNSQTGSTTVNITVDETVNSSIEAVATKVIPSVVGIRTTAAVQNFFGGSQESMGEGSGIIYTADGYIITNYHVIESATETENSSIEVFLSNDTSTSIPATIVGYNIVSDLAVIKIEKSGLTPIKLANSTELKVGQYVVAVGAPGGLEYMGSVTNGIISGLNRKISSNNETDVPLIQTNAAINPGNSGGALVNLQGDLIGVNSAKIVSESYEGMGFAIPTDTMIDIVQKIIAKENNPDPYIGVTFSDVWTPTRLQQYGYPVGAVITGVKDGGPAAEAGIRAGDIIVEFNDKPVGSVAELNDAISDQKIGATVSVKIYRSGRYYSTAIVIGSNNAQ